MNVPGLGITDCVLMRRAPQGYFDVVVSENLNSLVREIVDDGTETLRANQQEVKQANLGKQIAGSVLSGMDQAKVADNALMKALELARKPADDAARQRSRRKKMRAIATPTRC